MDQLETRELGYFVAVAEELHFGRAAERLGIAQPPLSRAISRLERRMGVRLLTRTSRAVGLTPAGEVFLNEARTALDAVDSAVRRAQRAGRRDRLVVAARSGTGTGLLADALSAYGSGRDDASVEVVFTSDQSAALRNGTADIGLVCADANLDGLQTVELTRERPVALLPIGHPLATRAAVASAELRRQETFVAECPSMALDEIVDLVSMGRLIVIAGDSVIDRLGSAVVAVPVSDLPGNLLVLAWPGDGTREAARGGFVRAARTAVAERARR